MSDVSALSIVDRGQHVACMFIFSYTSVTVWNWYEVFTEYDCYMENAPTKDVTKSPQ